MNSMIDSTESRLTLSPEKQRKSVKPLKKQLRPRTKKNYCELSRLSETSNSNEQTITNTKKFNIKNNKKSVPIYKSIKLSQENFKDKEEIYTFPDESQDNDQKIKQMKKTCKKTTAKQIKKIKTSRILGTLRNQRKNIKKGPINVNFKEQNEKKIVKSIQNHMNPEYLQGAENSTISEVSTIKISSNDKLQDSKKINLTVTPSIPKLITSELKLFGPKNAITSKPTMQYSHMINHSLIRKSMSPITKLVENFDAGSPWRSIDTFSRVQQIVQSTPQINKLPLMRTKKLSAPKINFNKSIASNDTIQVLSSVFSKQNKLEDTKVSIINDHKISPRKFGTVLSNISSFHSKNVQNINKSPIKDNQQSSVTTILQMSFTDNNTTLSTQTESLKTNLLEFPINQEKSYVNKENTITPKKTARKKFSSPSPFRFDKMHSSKRTLYVEPRSKTQTITDEEFKIETTLLHHGDLKPTILRQSNLNNFLNIDQMPEETHISTIHGIFNDVHSTPIKGRKFKKLIIEPTIENAFGFDDSDVHEIPSVNNSSMSIINKKHNVKSTKENTTSKVKDKLQISSRILENPAKKLILKSGLKKKPKETIESYINKNINIIEKNDNKTIEKLISGNELQLSNKSVLDSILFSDTFDILCEKKEIKLPKEFPLFIDLQPVHFSEPPRRSYQKRKREILLDINKYNFVEEKDEYNEPRLKKKKVTKINKEERKRIKEWVKNINETFEEIDHFDLIVE
ncbi:PREDICTED: uncharacterized protein LOC105366977 [Ceratosolen solmsi marchali]|uniref:Uncharacterized protein LOC105366977 n=1 Tax=Ceratosolen solmsi marchali TaxID=326594 RepID=A0AAJ6YTH2_9HYME|nr:PREDICTED: uncharacterized protein LOC105366977 [Ceratosolen solmsi marchali]